jgi:2-polyprenyl-6-methoxyphenol hydroxylase-like FAD-dependent oxidoreductase
MKVMIIGAGIGGLALAQALKKAGIEVTVFERDSSAMSRMQGYAIFLTGKGASALRECLPSNLWKTLLNSRYKLQDKLNFATEQLDLVLSWPNKPNVIEKRGCNLARSDLRRILLTDLEKVICFNKTFTSYKHGSGGKIMAQFEDGTSVTGDLLVGADGIHSQVRKQLLGVGAGDTGVLALVANTPPTVELRRLLEGTPLATTTFILGRDGWGAMSAKLEHRDTIRDHIFWTIFAQRGKWELKEEPESVDKSGLLNIAKERTQNWHPAFRHVVENADASSASFWPLVRAVKVEPWTNSLVTLLGDAVHSMPPTLSMGGNSALRDARLLSQKLVEVHQGALSKERALNEYVKEMTKSTFPILDSSMRVLDFVTITMGGTTKRQLATSLLKIVNVVIPPKLKLALGSLRRNRKQQTVESFQY